MKISPQARIAIAFLTALVISSATSGAGFGRNKAKGPSPAAASLDDYIKRVSAAGIETPATTGSLWVSTGPLSEVAADYKARFAGDPIVVNLVDTFSATNTGQNKTSRQFTTQSGITALLRALPANNSLQNLLSANSTTSLNGQGASSFGSTLQLSLSGRVVQTMPNGMLVIEASRDFTVGVDRQTVVLHGLVRPGDIASNNTIQSSSVTSLELSVKGKGAVADATAQPSIIMRVLLKLFSF